MEMLSSLDPEINLAGVPRRAPQIRANLDRNW